MKTHKIALLLAAASMLAPSFAAAQEARPYAEGPVLRVSYIKTKPGMFDAYMSWVATQRKALMEGEKKAGIILDYKIFVTEPRGPQDADIILTVTYKNYAALDGLDERVEVVDKTVFESRAKANAAAISRESMREVLGSQTIRELVLK
jgi:hypothetical protein